MLDARPSRFAMWRRQLIRSGMSARAVCAANKESLVNTRIKMAQAHQRSADRRAREQEAPRLLSLVPNLSELEIAIVELSGVASVSHRKRFAVATAPALIIIPCGDPNCDDGGHDITYDVLQTLRGGQTQARREHDCRGQVASAPCRRRIEYDVRATYVPLRQPRE
jgi:hypothetical protein